MKISIDNISVANDAMASVLLLYYQLVSGGGFVGDETVYLDPERFNGMDFIDLQVDPELLGEVDLKLIQQGAVIYLLCELNDMISEFEEDCLSQDFTRKVLAGLEGSAGMIIPETEQLIDLVKVEKSALDYAKYQKLLELVYQKYVLGTFTQLGKGRTVSEQVDAIPVVH